MKNLTKVLSGLMALSMLALTACGSSSTPSSSGGNDTPKATDAPKSAADPAASEGKVLKIYAWNTEFQSRFNDYFKSLPSDVEVEWVITPSDDNAYQNKLDADLPSNDGSDNPIDIFLIEADYATKYIDTEYALDVKGDIGLTDADLKDQYKYTQEIVTSSDGKLKGTTWQATPGLFAYRRSIAKDVLGTDDPVEVQKSLSDWDKFDATAAKMDGKGYKMLSGYDDAFRTFSNNKSAAWVDASGNLSVDANMLRWVDQTKTYTDKGYNNKTRLWAPEWQADQGPSGKVFGFFYSTWGINFTLLGNSLATPVPEGLSKASDPDGYAKFVTGNGAYGDYAVCEGPESYYWGGTWICAAKGTDNATLIADVMRTLTCDSATMKQITLDTEDYTNNLTAMNEIANDPTYGSAFLGGQNHIALFNASAGKIDMSTISKYDQGCTESFQDAFNDYYNGDVDKKTALSNFFTAIVEMYPNLKTPNVDDVIK